METKTSKLIEMVQREDFDNALKLAKTFKIWDCKQDKEQVILASEIKSNSSFYKQLGKDIELEYQKDVEVLKRVYGKLEVAV